MPAKPRSDADRVKYLARALQFNPVHEASDLLTLRRRFLGIASAGHADPADGERLRAQRERVVSQLDELRENFWTMTPAELQTAFAAIKSEPYPDLQLAVDRLKTLAVSRPKLAELSTRKTFDRELFASLKRVLVLPPRAAEGVREKAVKSLDSLKRVARARRMAKLLKQELPEIYALESVWLQRLGGVKPATTADSGLGSWFRWEWVSLGNLSWVGFVILLIVLRQIVRAVSGGSP